MRVAGTVAVVTGGAGRGAGSAIARRLAADGASVLVVDIDQERGSETASRITEAGGTGVFFAADVTHPATVHVLMDFVEAQYGGLDIVVNNATEDPAPRSPLDGWAHALDVDLVGPALLIHAAIGSMRRRGGGAVVNISSVSAIPHGVSSPWPAYDVAKAGILRLTTALGSLQQEGIRVNCIAPGWIASPPVQAYVNSLSPAQRAERRVPQRLLPPDEVAAAVTMLIADDSLAGRVLLLRNDEPHAFIAAGDRGYASLEPLETELD